ncbi:MAG TPA: Re/Si-specific NAD(P)(+) transhydrogenase subunit alpha [Longimicrobiales bacterium]
MKVVIPKEITPRENRVALTPEGVQKFQGLGCDMWVETGAGVPAGFTDAAYEKAGATIAPDAASLYREAEIVLKVQAPRLGDIDEVSRIPSGALLAGFLSPLTSMDLLARLASQRVTALAVELIPRITRAQVMDALSSQATVAGYKAALNAASASGRFFPMLMTAAGTVPPAKVLVIGAGVAGLQAIATARRLGAVVSGFDIRPVAKEQVESLGATWVGIQMDEAETSGGYAKEMTEDAKRKEHEHLRKLVGDSDVVITTAQVPGRRAPVLVTRDMVEAMKPGSVIVDCAAEQGGNCELTQSGKDVTHNGVLIQGPVNLAASLANHASFMYSRNLVALVSPMIKDGDYVVNLEDDVIGPCCVTHDGEVRVGKPAMAAST